MNWPPRWFALGATAVLVAGVAAPASAEPPGPPPPATPPAAGAAAPAPARVTLITGDVVELDRVAPGRATVTVRPAAGRERVTFHTVTVDGQLRVLPSDVVPYLASGVLDPDLFDVEELVAQGYGDADTGRLPLIVRYRDGANRRAGAFAATATDVRPLPSIDGAALAVGKGELGGLWSALRAQGAGVAAATASGRLGAGVERVWLDGRVHPVLDRSVAQIGAPAAWAAGRDGAGVKVAVLDTGIDAGHPDLADRIADSRDFTGAGGVADGHGHGTHVASIIAGSGAAAGGTRKGVAPGARLVVGKVLDDSGSGYDSWIIEGMEWAARSGARVVSMSLGGSPTDGTDPMSQAVNDLTAETGTLFVVAAGNSGADYAVNAPGAADAALTVGAVDRDDALAPFSSRGPRVGDNAVKPEITAPGVGIVAARAAGTTMGEPVDDRYTAASGTSMATPHVAGAAAILAQDHPDWRADRLKDALVSTARGAAGQSVFAQGGGRVDVARALGQRVYASAVADFRRIDPATPGDGLRREVAYTNLTGVTQTLRLRLEVRNVDRNADEPDGFALGGDEVTVPAGATVPVSVTADPAKLDRGRHGGWLVATGADGVQTRTALAATLSGPRHTVTLRGVDRSGRSTSVPVVTLFGEQPESDSLGWIPEGGEVTFTVEEGTYLMHAVIEDGVPLDEQSTLLVDPQLSVTGDVTVVLDARRATPVRIETPKPAEQQTTLAYYVHRVFGNGRQIDHGVMQFSTIGRLNVTPTARVTDGEFEFASRWQLVAPMVRARVTGVRGPLDVNLMYQSPDADLHRDLPLVDAGTGAPDELGGVRGAAALVSASPDRSEEEQVAAAAAAGAAVVLVVRPADRSAWTSWSPQGDRFAVPAMALPYDDGQRVLAAAARGARVQLAVTVSSPYLYDVFQVSRQQVPATVVHRVTAANSARLTTRYVDTGGFAWAKEQRFGWRPWQQFALETQRIVRTGTAREEWVSAGDSLWRQRASRLYVWSDGQLLGGATEPLRRYTGGSSATRSWFAPVVRPALAGPSTASRSGDLLDLRIAPFVDADGHWSGADGESMDTVRAVLWRDGRQVADLSTGEPVVTVADRARYRLELDTTRGAEEWRWAARTHTAWEFTSARPVGTDPAPLPLLQLDYRVPTDLSGTVDGGRPHRVGLTLRHQAGLPAPTGARVDVEVSFDDGAHWRAAPVTGSGAAWTATVPAGTGGVSLRVRATDGAGSTVEQSVIGAYGLR
ncbi:S8 family serine peptidase [Micromonospora mirobrigensis]|uniref:PA domain-containing protein n=1 Tax=Micromonospora mirobrigensis TaxID=262898 RepID=A0A1C5ALC5_9ACTN|nr:S8 family serine peptidase [Micromonospora mirobrigensis]SCF46017.1 PA domain-containing protein [Micromonospora mirobrigensis]